MFARHHNNSPLSTAKSARASPERFGVSNTPVLVYCPAKCFVDFV